MNTDEHLLDAKELAQTLGISASWVYAHTGRRKPTMPHIRMGSSLRFRRESVVRWLKDWEIIGDRPHTN